MGTCHSPINKKILTYALNKNMMNYKYPRKGVCHPHDDHHHDHHHIHHPSDNNGRDSGVLVEGLVVGGGEE